MSFIIIRPDCIDIACDFCGEIVAVHQPTKRKAQEYAEQKRAWTLSWDTTHTSAIHICPSCAFNRALAPEDFEKKKMVHHKFCPLFTIAATTDPGISGECMLCKKEDCGMWNVHRKCCGLVYPFIPAYTRRK